MSDFKFVKREEKQDLEQTRKSLTYWQDVWRRLRNNKMSMVGLVVVIFIVLFAIFGPYLTPYDEAEQYNDLKNLPPRLDVFEIEEGKFIHRTEAYDLIEFDEDGNVVAVLKEVNEDQDNKIKEYSYEFEYVYDLVEGGAYPLPAEVVLDENTFYSEVWGIAFQDVNIDTSEQGVVIAYIHPDSPFLDGELASFNDLDDWIGTTIDRIILTDNITDPDIPDDYSVKAERTAKFMVIDMEKEIILTDILKGKLKSITLFDDFVTLDYSLKVLDPEERPEGQEDVEFVFTYKGETTNTVAMTVSNNQFKWGTDSLGRDVLTRVMYGARISLLVALIATTVNLLIGITYGSISGYRGGNVDNIMMRIVDIINSIPLTLYVILLMVVLRERTIEVGGTVIFNGSDGFTAIVVALGSVYWVGMARLVRGQILGLKEQEFVLAARTIGVSNRKIIFRHLIPNALGPIIVSMTMMIPSAIFTEAFLSFIGIGVSAPQASWGTLANEARGSILRYPYQLFFPSLAIAVTMLGFNFLGDGLRDALDPRLRKG